MSDTPNSAHPEPEERLRALAARTTPGPWHTVTDRPFGVWHDRDSEPMAGDNQPVLVRNWKDACLNASYIVAAQPANLLLILDAKDAEIERLRASLAEAEQRSGILLEITEERSRQDQQWGGPEHDDAHDATDWKNFRREFEVRALKGHPTLRRDALVKLAALAVAQIESFDRAALHTAEDSPNA